MQHFRSLTKNTKMSFFLHMYIAIGHFILTPTRVWHMYVTFLEGRNLATWGHVWKMWRMCVTAFKMWHTHVTFTSCDTHLSLSLTGNKAKCIVFINFLFNVTLHASFIIFLVALHTWPVPKYHTVVRPFGIPKTTRKTFHVYYNIKTEQIYSNLYIQSLIHWMLLLFLILTHILILY